MFDEYTDPYDIDNYYADVGQIFDKIADYVDTKQIQPVVASAEPTLPLTSSIPNTDVPAVSKFEVIPNSIWIDQHPVGAQPKYNILQSGAPEKESFLEKESFPGHKYRHRHDISNIMFITISIIFFLMFVYIVRLQTQMNETNTLMQLLIRELIKKG